MLVYCHVTFLFLLFLLEAGVAELIIVAVAPRPLVTIALAARISPLLSASSAVIRSGGPDADRLQKWLIDLVSVGSMLGALHSGRNHAAMLWTETSLQVVLLVRSGRIRQLT